MKKVYTSFSFVVLFLLMLSGCKNMESTQIDLSGDWKFKTGDSITWLQPSYNDSGWDTLLVGPTWESQGYTDYNGFAWYRKKIVIPSSIKDNAYLKDSVLFFLGRIDDCDQVFLNGELIGQNARTLLSKGTASDSFSKEEWRWNLDRRYILPANDSRILWDKENFIAIRVYDHGGEGGVFSKPFTVSMLDVQDYIKFDFSKTAFVFHGDSGISKKYSIQNLSKANDFVGKLKIELINPWNKNILESTEEDVQLLKNTTLDKELSISTSLNKPVCVRFTFTEATSGKGFVERFHLPYLLTPKTAPEPRITGAKVFGVRPWSPFFFKVSATGKPPLMYAANNLPEGLKIDSLTGIIKGRINKKGDYLVHLVVKNEVGVAERDLKIVAGELISLTPPMGWNSWNCWGLSVSDKKVRQSADAMKNSGLADHGWSYINIDDGWEDKHDKDGTILSNYKFPNMYGLCDYVHSLGLKIGIYSSPGPKTCGGYEGSYTFEEKDAQMYANWGIDYLKYDWCSYGNIAPNPNLQQFKHPYKVMKKAIRQVNRDIHYSLCQYGMGNVWEWGAEVDGNSWRTTGDITDSWESMFTIGFNQDLCAPFTAPGRWNDPDMLVVGWVGWGPSLHYTRLTPDEQYTHITLWSLLSSPLLIGCDLEQLDPFTMNLLTNDEVIEVNQDPKGLPATQVKKNDQYRIWVKELEDGSKAVGLFNISDKPGYIPVDLVDLGLSGAHSMRNLWTQQELGMVRTHFEMWVMPHGAAMVKLAK